MNRRTIETMKLRISLIAIFCLVCSVSQAQTIFSFDFSGDTVGSSPSGWTSVSPGTPAALNGAIVTNVSGNNQVNMYDYNTSSNARLEEDFTGNSSLHLSLTFTRNATITPTTSTQGLYVSLGSNTLSQGTLANRALDIRLFNDGTYRIDRGFVSGSTYLSNGVTSATTFETSIGTHTLDIFAYGGTYGDSGYSYTGPDSVARLLDAHSFAIYLDGSMLLPSSYGLTANGNYAFQNASFYNSSELGRFGLVTGGASAVSGMDYLVDNIQLAVIPEPSAFLLLGSGGLLLVGMLRRSRRS